ncbi:MAG: hypothetical protein IPG73_03390 [Ignavibacteria bacterium]|nr:hypothetical protein [Ignavibacteria bacterium]
MKATSSLHGYEVEQIDGATLVVNGESRNLLYGFPFRGTPEKLYLSTSVDSLTIAYRSPRNFEVHQREPQERGHTQNGPGESVFSIDPSNAKW